MLAARNAELQSREALLESRAVLLDTIRELAKRDAEPGVCRSLKVRDADAWYDTGC